MFTTQILIILLTTGTAVACPTNTSVQHIGYKDFWPLETDLTQGHAKTGDELEAPLTVSDRMSQFFIDRPSLHLLDVDYVLYAQLALKDRDQRLQNAPLAVNRDRGGGGENSEDLESITNIEVWRCTFTTRDSAAYAAVMGEDKEVVVGAATIVASSCYLTMSLAALALLLA